MRSCHIRELLIFCDLNLIPFPSRYDRDEVPPAGNDDHNNVAEKKQDECTGKNEMPDTRIIVTS